MFSSAGSTLTQIAGRQSLGTNLRPLLATICDKAERRGCNLLASVEKQEPPSNRQKRQKELTSDRKEKGDEQARKHSRLPQRTRRLDDSQRENTHDQQQQVLEVVKRPPMTL